jgi:outer membrane protein TolC
MVRTTVARTTAVALSALVGLGGLCSCEVIRPRAPSLVAGRPADGGPPASPGAATSSTSVPAPARGAADEPGSPSEPSAGGAAEAPAASGSAHAAGASLARCLYLADRNHPDLLAARARLGRVRAQLLEAYSAPYMNFTATGGLALAPTVLGNSTFSPNTDVSLTSSLGMAWRAGIDGVLPLWTFGKITNLWDAAEAGVRVSEAEVDVTRDAIRFDVRRAYFGLQLARDALALLDDAQGKMDEAVDKLRQKLAHDEGDPIDLLKLQTFASELVVRRSEAEKGARVALAGLRFYTGSPKLQIPDAPLTPSKHVLGPLAKYVGAAAEYRPDVRMARAGVEAREAQVRLGQSGLYPDLALAMWLGVATAPEVADQINPFVTDPANYFHYGAALVFQWKLDVVPQVARIQQAQAQLDEVQALSLKAKTGVPAEVEEAYADVVDWRKRLDAYQQAVKFAKTWLSTVQEAIDIGTMEDKDLVDPAKAYAEQRYNVLRATMELNLAMSKLAKTTGWDAIAPEAP